MLQKMMETIVIALFISKNLECINQTGSFQVRSVVENSYGYIVRDNEQCTQIPDGCRMIDDEGMHT